MSRGGLSAFVISLSFHGAVLGWLAWDGWSPGRTPSGQITVIEVQVVSASGEVQAGSSRVGALRPKEPVSRGHSEAPERATDDKAPSVHQAASDTDPLPQVHADDASPDARPVVVVPIAHGAGSPASSMSLEERLRAIRARIEQQKTYPSSARREGIEGTTTLAFRIREGGAVEEARVLKSSGSSLLDEASLEAVRRAAPLPPVEGEIRVSLVFQLRSL